tara:strand:+ start:313 stop:525 length:213 start_codon:yes stop_codon:yes gene_type:complete
MTIPFLLITRDKDKSKNEYIKVSHRKTLLLISEVINTDIYTPSSFAFLGVGESTITEDRFCRVKNTPLIS